MTDTITLEPALLMQSMSMIPIGRLKAGPNPRKVNADASYFDQLVASIRAEGLLQPLTVAIADENYEVIIGNRRLSALQKIFNDPETVVPCMVVSMDEIDTLAAAVAENIMRADMHPMDEYLAFVQLQKLGQTPEDIAERFGMTERTVQKRLALGKLVPSVRKAFTDGKINLSCAMEYTLLDEKQQRKFLKEGCTAAWQVRRDALSGTRNMDHAMFDTRLYKGALITDMFNDEQFAVDAPLFHSLQYAWCEEEVARQRASGKAFCELLIDTYSWDVKGYTPCEPDDPDCGMMVMLSSQTSHVDIVTMKMSAKRKAAIENGEPAITPKENKDPNALTTGQRKIMAEAAHRAAAATITTYDAIRLFFRHIPPRLNHRGEDDTGYYYQFNGDLNDANPTVLMNEFVRVMAAIMPAEDAVAPDIEMLSRNHTTLRRNWVPDADFISKYNQPQLATLAHKLGVPVKNLTRKKDVVEAIVAGFSDADNNKAAEWLPKKY